MVHTGNQKYTPDQWTSMLHLVAYLQGHYGISDQNIVTHHYVQPSDRTDPVDFDWDEFLTAKNRFRHDALASQKLTRMAHHNPTAPTAVHPAGGRS